ncbi:MAG TPA: dihydroorotase, partial [Sulfurivirga caldicuralii]|nr:dihydroorotase [Sulfurivirga caldicuralii]
MKLRIDNARLLDPALGLDIHGSLCVEGSRIVAFGQAPDDFVPDLIRDAAGQWLFPGLIDLQARTGEPGDKATGTVASEATAATAGGITTLCVPPDTNPVADTAAVPELIRRRARQAGKAFVLPIGALTQGLEGERLAPLHSLKQAGCIAVSQGNAPIRNTLTLRNALAYAASHGILVIIKPQDSDLANAGVAHDGAVASRLGLPGIPASAETTALAQLLLLIEETGARVHISGLSTARAVELIEQARRNGLAVTCDVAVHHLHLSENDLMDFNPLFNVRPPLRSMADQQALRQGLRLDLIDCITSDHTPASEEDKALPFPQAKPGISGLETLLNLTLRLVDEGQLTLLQALHKLSTAPARILGIDGGTLQPGSRASFVLFDPETHWTVHAPALLSAGKNSPFHGWTFQGRVVATWFQGKCVFERKN